jgi:hypothetical protein
VQEKVYAGRSSGNEVTVAIAVRDGRAVAYICDGRKVEAWLEGTLQGGALSLQGPDGASITGTADEKASFGTVVAGGEDRPYAATGVQAPKGLYEGRADVRGVANRIGWIVLDDGTEVGLRRSGTDLLPAPALDPANPNGVLLDEVPVAVRPLTGSDRVVGS